VLAAVVLVSSCLLCALYYLCCRVFGVSEASTSSLLKIEDEVK
jgi:hypothetical protein